jgi:hypothetical protein
VFNHEKPIKITATGHLMETGVDECATVVLSYTDNRIAQINYSSATVKFAPAFIVGDKGVLQIPDNMWCPTEIILADGTRVNKPVEPLDTNFLNSFGFSYEAEAVRDAISQGLLEHPKCTHQNSRLVGDIIDEIRRQLGCE